MKEKAGRSGQEDGEEDEEEEDDYTIKFGSHNTTLRKSSGYALGAISKMYPEETYQVLKSYLEQAVAMTLIDSGNSSADQYVYHDGNPALDLKEAAILALGSISDADGCLASSMESAISGLVAFLVQELNSSSKLISSSALWTLSKFATWISENLEDGDFNVYIDSVSKKLNDTD
jgi:hypothetical protein